MEHPCDSWQKICGHNLENIWQKSSKLTLTESLVKLVIIAKWFERVLMTSQGAAQSERQVVVISWKIFETCYPLISAKLVQMTESYICEVT